MYVVVVGAGEVGSYLARILVEEGHEVALVEVDEELAHRLDASMNALVVPGSGVDPSVLRKAGLEGADLLLAVTAVDEVNLITCMTARKHGGRKLRVIARVRQSRLTRGAALSADDLGLDALVGPEDALAEAIMESLLFVGSGEVHELAAGRLVVVGMALHEDSPLVHGTLASLRDVLPREALVVAVQDQAGYRIPKGSDRLRPQERAFILTRPQDGIELAILSGLPWFKVRRVLVVGCGGTGLAVARLLRKRRLETTIIERDPHRAEVVAGLLPDALVLQGDGTDPALLQARIEDGEIDAVLVLLADSERSVLIGIFAKSLGARKVIVRCDKPAYGHLASRLGVDALISPKQAMTDAILRHLRRGDVRSTLVLGEHEIELTEFTIPTKLTSKKLVGHPLKELRFPEGTLVAAVVRDDVFIPSGETVLLPGDRLIVACLPSAVARVDKLLA